MTLHHQDLPLCRSVRDSIWHYLDSSLNDKVVSGSELLVGLARGCAKTAKEYRNSRATLHSARRARFGECDLQLATKTAQTSDAPPSLLLSSSLRPTIQQSQTRRQFPPTVLMLGHSDRRSRTPFQHVFPRRQMKSRSGDPDGTKELGYVPSIL